MPLILLNPAFVAIRGRVGAVVFKTYRDKVVVTRVPGSSPLRATSPAMSLPTASRSITSRPSPARNRGRPSLQFALTMRRIRFAGACLQAIGCDENRLPADLPPGRIVST